MLMLNWSSNCCNPDQTFLYRQKDGSTVALPTDDGLIVAESLGVDEEQESSSSSLSPSLFYCSHQQTLHIPLKRSQDEFISDVPRPIGSLSSLKLSKLFMGYGTFSALTVDGQIYMWGRSDYGQCGVIEENTLTPRSVPVRTKDIKCRHGCQIKGKDIYFSQIVHSSKAVIALSQNQQVWHWGMLTNEKQSRLEPHLIDGFADKAVVKLASGKNHFCALVETKIQEKGEKTPNMTEVKRRSIGQTDGEFTQIDSCHECDEERLSRLMLLAPNREVRTKEIEGDHTPTDIMSDDGGEYLSTSFKLELNPASPDKRSLTLEPTACLLQQNNELIDSNSIKTLPTDIEKEVEKLELKPIRKGRLGTGDVHSFVDIGLFPEARFQNDSSDETRSTNSSSFSSVGGETSRNNSFTESQKDLDHFGIIGIDSILPTEVWTWGENSAGQLGHGDFVTRREPGRIDRLNDANITRVCAGDEHTVALTATGEVFVWGSNAFGQLKQGESKSVSVPVVFKVGSQSSVLDVSAGSDFTVLIVNGLDCHPVLYYCGKDHSDKSASITTTRLSYAEKFGSPVSLRVFGGTHLLASIIPRTDAEHEEGRISAAFDLSFGELKFSRDLSQLYSLVNQMYQRAVLRPNPKLPDVPILLYQYGESLHGLSILVGSSAEQMRHVIREWMPEARYDWLLHVALSKRYIDSLKQLHGQFASLVAIGCFAEFDIGDALTEAVQRMSLEYETESRKQHRQLKKLFGFPFNRLHEYCEMARTTSKYYEQGSEMAQTLTASIAKWKIQAQILTNVAHVAEKTYTFWCEHGTHTAVQHGGLKLSGRLLFKSYDHYGKQVDSKIKNIISAGWSKTWYYLLIFNDCLVLVEKKEATVLKYPLVWISTQEHETKYLVLVSGPETEFNVEFDTAAAKAEFIQTVNQALLKHMRNGLYSNECKPGTTPPFKRRGVYKFIGKTNNLQGVAYDGLWMFAKPHGNGKMLWPDGRAYVGRFVDGLPHGYGTMRTDVQFRNETATGLTNGFWRQGKLNGLAVIEYGDRTVYEGFTRQDQRHGYGVLRYMSSRNQYIGAWSHDKRHGYGVWSTQREKYLGMWEDDLEHGLGTLVCIDGTCYEGTFEKGVFVKGVMHCNDNTWFEGEFNGLGMLNGKGVLRFGENDKIRGTFSGSLLLGQVHINNGVLERNPITPSSPDAVKMFDAQNRRSSMFGGGAPWVPSDQKWTEMFDHFRCGDLNMKYEQWDTVDTEAAWCALASAVNEIQKAVNEKNPDARKGSLATDTKMDILETIPAWEQHWSDVYHSMVKLYSETAISVELHPLSRLVHGLFEVFSSSYSGVAANPLLLEQAVEELKSIVRRTILFPSLPRTNEMHSLISPNDVERNQELTNSETPCSFITDKMVGLCYATVFTLYAVHCEENDQKYWQRVTLLNSRNDVTLLRFLDVAQHLWPIEMKEDGQTKHPIELATAKYKYYASAINMLQRLSSEFCPSAKLRVLRKVFEEVDKCVRLYSESSVNHVWNMDYLCPVFMYVVIRARLQRLGAEIRLIDDFVPQLGQLGSLTMMFTTLKACYYQIIKEKSVP